MTNVFISYERGAEAIVRKVGEALAAAGHTIWTDAELPPHRAYADVIEERLSAADAVLVLWSAAAARSQWVRAEAEHARERGKLVQATLDGALPPMPFNQTQCASLQGWTGDRNAVGWRKVLASLDQLGTAETRPPPAVAPPTRVASLKSSLPRAWLLAAAVFAVVVAATLTALLMLDHPANAVGQGRVAILPLVALSETPDAKNVAKALGDEIFTTLNSNEISAVSQDDAETLQGPDRLARLKALGVSLLFSGTVEDNGKTVDIKVHLDDPVHHATIWTGGARGDAAVLPTLRVKVAKTAANVLGCSNRALKPGGLTDPALLSRYLRTCDLFTNRDSANGTANTFQLISNLRQVIAGAPNFVPAHTDLAKFEAFLAPTMPADAAASMRAESAREADKALALNPKSPDAYLAKEMLLPRTAWAEREAMLRKGVAIDPDWPHTNGFLAFLLQETGRIQEAKIFGAHAGAADLQIDWRTEAAWIACDAGDFEPSTSDMQSALAANPGDGDTQYAVRTCLTDAGRYREACALDKLGDIQPTSLWALVCKALETKLPADRQIAIQKAMDIAKESDSDRIHAVARLILLGDVEDAFRLSDGLVAGYPVDGSFVTYLFKPGAKALWRDSRFMKLAARLKLVDFWRTSGKWPDFCKEPDLPYNCKVEAEKVSKP